jgi:hypothetical protein
MKGKKEYSLMNEEGFNEAVKEAYTVVFDEMVVRFYSLRGSATTILFMFLSWQCTYIYRRR